LVSGRRFKLLNTTKSVVAYQKLGNCLKNVIKINLNFILLKINEHSVRTGLGAPA
jgi:hypothetical protein